MDHNRARARARRATTALLLTLALVAGACTRDDSTTPSTGGTGTTAPADEGSAGRLDAGAFGDLDAVCQDGDGGAGAGEDGLTADTVQIGTITDKGFTSRPGLTVEMLDAAHAFAAWCNEHGGIHGRELIVADRDAALGEYNARILEACAEDFALVGGGGVLDESDNGERVRCGVPSVPGYVVSDAARAADLQVSPVPYPVDTVDFGPYQEVAEQHPDLERYGVLTGQFGSLLGVRDDLVAAAEGAGFEVVYDREYNALGESNWVPFAQAIKDAGVEVLELVGEPTYFGQVLLAMEEVGYRPQIILQQTNFYDSTFAAESGSRAENVYVRTSFTPVEEAASNPATADYLELMERYRPDGKVAHLGMQAVSALLLFARSATACGADLTRACLLEEAGSVTEWTGGGLHPATNPAANRPSPCFVLLTVSGEDFVVDETLTQPDEGIFNCEEDNLVTVPG